MWIIDIHSRTHIAMAKILLNDLHVHVQRHEKRSAGVAQVVEADIPHPVLLQQLREARGDITRLDQLPQGVDTDHVKIFFAVGSAELFTIKLLTFLVRKEYFLDLGDHFEASS